MRDVHKKLVRALLDRAGAGSEVTRSATRPWASVTFCGHVASIDLVLPEPAAEAFLKGLEEAEFALPGHLVADVALINRRAEQGRALLEIEALVLEEA